MPEINDSITSKLSKLDSRFDKMLLRNIKHDLINPINAILGYSELIIDYLDEEKNGQFISDIKKIHESGSLLFKSINAYFTNNDEKPSKYIGEIINISELQFAIRTPISTIIGLTELLREDTDNNTSSYRKDINESFFISLLNVK